MMANPAIADDVVVEGLDSAEDLITFEDEPGTGNAPENENEEEIEDAPSADEIAGATNLLKALKNPATAQGAVANLLKAAGITLPTAAPQTKTEEKRIAKSITEQLLEELGDEYDKTAATKLGSAIEKVLNARFSEQDERLNQGARELKQAQVATQLNAALETFAAKIPQNGVQIDAKVMQAMETLAAKVGPGGLTHNEYIVMLYNQATSKMSKTVKNQSLEKKKLLPKLDSPEVKPEQSGKPVSFRDAAMQATKDVGEVI